MRLSNPKHERFCQEYIIDLNGAKAAERSGYSKKTARTQANQLLTKLDISERVAELKEIRSERTVVTQDMVLKELMILAHSDIRDYGEIVNQYGIKRLKLKTFKEIKGDATRAIKSITERVTKDNVQLSFTLHGKSQAIELLGKHLGMFVERHELTGEDGGPIKIEYVLVKVKKQKKGGDGKG